MWCCTTVEKLYPDQLDNSTLSYSSPAWCFDCIIIVFGLTDQRCINTEHTMSKLIVRYTLFSAWSMHCKSESISEKHFSTRNTDVVITRDSKIHLDPSSKAFARRLEGGTYLCGELMRLSGLFIVCCNVRQNRPRCSNQKKRLFGISTYWWRIIFPVGQSFVRGKSASAPLPVVFAAVCYISLNCKSKILAWNSLEWFRLVWFAAQHRYRCVGAQQFSVIRLRWMQLRASPKRWYLIIRAKKHW